MELGAGSLVLPSQLVLVCSAQTLSPGAHPCTQQPGLGQKAGGSRLQAPRLRAEFFQTSKWTTPQSAWCHGKRQDTGAPVTTENVFAQPGSLCSPRKTSRKTHAKKNRRRSGMCSKMLEQVVIARQPGATGSPAGPGKRKDAGVRSPRQRRDLPGAAEPVPLALRRARTGSTSVCSA